MNSFPSLDPADRRLVPLDHSGNPIEGKGEPGRICVAFTELRAKPDFGCAIDTQLVYGETVRIFAQHDGWLLVQAERDQYVGWLEADTVEEGMFTPTHLVSVPRTFFYPGPDLKLPHKGMRSMGSAVTVVEWVEKRGTQYCILETGEAVIARHVRPVDAHESDYASVAETLLRTPYLWAGTTGFGIDCSGIVKLALLMCGQLVLRDSDMQAATIGVPLPYDDTHENIERGDLIFWKGHVAICQGRDLSGEHRIIHANGHTMDVYSEPLKQAVDRIAYLYAKPIGTRRPNVKKTSQAR